MITKVRNKEIIDFYFLNYEHNQNICFTVNR